MKKKNIGSIIGGIAVVIVTVLILLYFEIVCPERHMLDRARESSAINTMNLLTRGIENYYNEYHTPLDQEHLALIRMLRGENDKKITFFATRPESFNENGKVIDSWGKPYQIEYHGKTDVTIISAGPNGHFDDEDDLTMVNGELKASSKGVTRRINIDGASQSPERRGWRSWK